MGDPVSGESFEAGKSVHFEAKFSDDIELGAYKIDIHNNFDGHSHGRVASSNEDPGLLKWSLSESFDFERGLKNSDVHLHDELKYLKTRWPALTTSLCQPWIDQAIQQAIRTTVPKK
jgi:hypothetical protein